MHKECLFLIQIIIRWRNTSSSANYHKITLLDFFQLNFEQNVILLVEKQTASYIHNRNTYKLRSKKNPL